MNHRFYAALAALSLLSVLNQGCSSSYLVRPSVLAAAQRVPQQERDLAVIPVMRQTLLHGPVPTHVTYRNLRLDRARPKGDLVAVPGRSRNLGLVAGGAVLTALGVATMATALGLAASALPCLSTSAPPYCGFQAIFSPGLFFVLAPLFMVPGTVMLAQGTPTAEVRTILPGTRNVIPDPAAPLPLAPVLKLRF